MTTALKVYSANEIDMIFALNPIDSGRGDDEFCSIAKQEDTFTYKAGVDGEGTRSESKNNYYVVTITVMRTSKANAFLSALHLLDRSTPGGAGIAPILVMDKQGASLFASAQAWIVKAPDDVYAKEAGTVQWQIGVHDPKHILGGN